MRVGPVSQCGKCVAHLHSGNVEFRISVSTTRLESAANPDRFAPMGSVSWFRTRSRYMVPSYMENSVGFAN